MDLVKPGDAGALAYAEEGLRLAQEQGNLGMMTYLYSTEGEIALGQGNLAAAEQHFKEGLALAERLNMPERVAGLTANLGLVAQARGESALALYRFSAAMAQADAIGTRHLASQIRLCLAPLLPPAPSRARPAGGRAFAQGGGGCARGGGAPCRLAGEERPVENVAWGEAQDFCRRLARLSGRTYRLPSEAQWEYACRAGGSAPFHTGETLTTDLANYCGEHVFRAEPAGLYRHVTTPAGAFPPNDFGLYDMHGNLWEWCADTWHANYTGAPAGDAAWNNGGERAARVVRGGS